MQPNVQNISHSSAPEHGVITFIMSLYHVFKAIFMINDTCHNINKEKYELDPTPNITHLYDSSDQSLQNK